MSRRNADSSGSDSDSATFDDAPSAATSDTVSSRSHRRSRSKSPATSRIPRKGFDSDDESEGRQDDQLFETESVSSSTSLFTNAELLPNPPDRGDEVEHLHARTVSTKAWLHALQNPGGVWASCFGANPDALPTGKAIAEATNPSPAKENSSTSRSSQYLQAFVSDRDTLVTAKSKAVPSKTGKASKQKPKTPYKSKEEQYDIIQEQKRHIAALEHAQTLTKAQIGKQEKELVNRDRRIESILSAIQDGPASIQRLKTDASLCLQLRLKNQELQQHVIQQRAEMRELEETATVVRLNELEHEAQVFFNEAMRLRQILEENTALDFSSTDINSASQEKKIAQYKEAAFGFRSEIKRLNNQLEAALGENYRLKNGGARPVIAASKKNGPREIAQLKTMAREELVGMVLDLTQKNKNTIRAQRTAKAELAAMGGQQARKIQGMRGKEEALVEEVDHLRDREAILQQRVEELEQALERVSRDGSKERRRDAADEKRARSKAHSRPREEEGRRGRSKTRRDSPARRSPPQSRSRSRSRSRDVSPARRRSRGRNSRSRSSPAPSAKSSASESNEAKAHAHSRRQSTERKRPRSARSRSRGADHQAAEAIQSAWRSHVTRKKFGESLERRRSPSRKRSQSPRRSKEDIERAERRRSPSRKRSQSPRRSKEDIERATTTIQSALRGHMTRARMLKDAKSRTSREASREASATPDGRDRGQGRPSREGSRARSCRDPGALVTLQNAVRGHLTRKRFMDRK